MFEKQHADYTILSKELQPYGKRMAEAFEFSAFLPFKDQFLCGNWDQKYGLVTFKDYSQDKKLKSFLAIQLEMEERETLSTFNFPYPFSKDVVDKMLEENRFISNHDLIENRSQGDFLTITSDSMFHGDEFKKEEWEEHKCRSSTLTAVQYAKIMLHIHSLPEEERDYILKFNQDKIKKTIEMNILSYRKTSPCTERPFALCIYGNDDCSYIKLFETKEAAWKCFKQLQYGSKIRDSYDFIHELGFDYDN